MRFRNPTVKELKHEMRRLRAIKEYSSNLDEFMHLVYKRAGRYRGDGQKLSNLCYALARLGFHPIANEVNRMFMWRFDWTPAKLPPKIEPKNRKAERQLRIKKLDRPRRLALDKEI